MNNSAGSNSKRVGEALEGGKALVSGATKLAGLAAAAWDGWRKAIPIPEDLRPLSTLLAMILSALALGLAAWRASQRTDADAVRDVLVYAAAGVVWLGVYVTGVRYLSAYGPGPLAALTLDYIQQVAYAAIFVLFSLAFFAVGLLLSKRM